LEEQQQEPHIWDQITLSTLKWKISHKKIPPLEKDVPEEEDESEEDNSKEDVPVEED
jgi:hypothetical protein